MMKVGGKQFENAKYKDVSGVGYFLTNKNSIERETIKLFVTLAKFTL